jgi:hypothetical protein
MGFFSRRNEPVEPRSAPPPRAQPDHLGKAPVANAEPTETRCRSGHPSSRSAVAGIAMSAEILLDDDNIPRELPAPSRAERKIASSSKGHCTAHMVLGDGPGVRMQAESHLEFCHFLILNADPSIVDLQEQVRFRYGPNYEREHVFDVVAARTTGSRIAYTIKPEVRLRSGRFLTEMQTVAWWVKKKRWADDVRLLTDADIDEVELHNAKVIAAVRDPDPEADLIARGVVATITGGVSVRDLTIATGMAARGYRAVLRLVREGYLVPARHERLTPQALVQKARAA